MLKKVKKISEKYMIISITEIRKNEYQIIFARENPFENCIYHGLIINSFKTRDSVLFRKFTRFGRWLPRKDSDIDVLLYLLKTEWKINTQVDFV